MSDSLIDLSTSRLALQGMALQGVALQGVALQGVALQGVTRSWAGAMWSIDARRSTLDARRSTLNAVADRIVEWKNSSIVDRRTRLFSVVCHEKL